MPRKRTVTHRRGLAMMLVLVSVALATILASAYLASRDNSLAIGQNATAAAAARWAALSAMETTVAALQTETDWRTNHTNGVLLENFPLAGAAVTVTALDLETNAPPTATSEYLQVTAKASVDLDGDGSAEGIQSTTIEAYVPTVAGKRVAIDLAEFAIFAGDDLTMSDSATLGRWATAPLSHLGRRILLGTQSRGAGSIDILDNAACIDTTIYYEQGASSSLITNETGPPLVEVVQPFEIPFVPGPGPGVPDPDGSVTTDLRPDPGDVITHSVSERFDDVLVENAELTLQGDITVICDDDCRVSAGGRIFIDGHVTLIVFDDLHVITEGAIELLDGATLTVHLGDNILAQDGYIGERRADNVRNHTGNAPYMDSLRIRYFSIDHLPEDRSWTIEQNSVLKGSFYGEPADVWILNDSAIYGRIAADDLYIRNNSGVYYDHALDEQQGYSNPDSPLIDQATGELDPDYLAITSLDDSALQALADATDAFVHAKGRTTVPASAVPAEPPPPGDPTPRPVLITYQIKSFGMSMAPWERSHADPAVVEGGAGGSGGGKQQVN